MDDPAHPDALRQKIGVYQESFGRCFEIARAHGLRVLITTDIMYYRAGEEPSQWGRLEQALLSLERSLEQLFQRYPAVAGIVTRIGETDGLDVGATSAATWSSVRPARRAACWTGCCPWWSAIIAGGVSAPGAWAPIASAT